MSRFCFIALFLLALSQGYSQSTISGILYYSNLSQSPMDGVKLYLESLSGQMLDSTFTNQAGFYKFYHRSAGQYFVSPACSKSWGGANSTDALLIQKHFIGASSLSGIKLKAGDVNASGNVNAIDALQNARRFTMLISSFAAGDWAFTRDTILVDGINPVQQNIAGLCFGDVNGSYAPLPCVPHPTQADAGVDAMNIPGIYVTLNANLPVIGTGHWKVISGSNYSFSDSLIHNPVFTGSPGQSYELTWNISTLCYTSTDTVNISFINGDGLPCPGIPFFEYGGQIYNTVKIGSQCWMKENLNFGTTIPGSLNQTNNNITEKYCYNDDTAMCDIYGGLYQWDELMQYNATLGGQGICPAGFHIPTGGEWNNLFAHLDGDAGKMKEAGFSHWLAPNTGATNECGFTALGGGMVHLGTFYSLQEVYYFYTSSELNSQYARWYFLTDHTQSVIRGAGKISGMSVRCLRDTCNMPPVQSDAGPDQIGLTNDSTFLDANVLPDGQTGTWRFADNECGIVMQPLAPNSLFIGYAGESYQLIWTVSNGCKAVSMDTVMISFADAVYQACPGISSFAYGGQIYNTVQIGSQCWMKENLNIGNMVIDHYTGNYHSHSSNNGIIEKYCLNNDSAYCAEYGGLYEWDEMMQYNTIPGTQGICPAGFHIPEYEEWTELETFLGDTSVAGGKMKELCFSHWWSPNSGASNVSGFTALGAGSRHFMGFMGSEYRSAAFWSSTEANSMNSYTRYLYYGSEVIYHSFLFGKYSGISVRCIKDTCSQPPTQSDAGPDQSVQVTTTQLAGNAPSSGSGNWCIVSGNGGALSDLNNPVSNFLGVPGSVYLLTWSISTACSSSIDTVMITFILNCGNSVIYGGQVYHEVAIGSQCWMKENINIGSMINGSVNASNNSLFEKYCYNNSAANCAIFGGLYSWQEMMNYNGNEGGQGICPDGWHIPSDLEWCVLTKYLDGAVVCDVEGWSGVNVAGKLRESGFTHWNAPNTSDNASGFSALGSGVGNSDGTFANMLIVTRFWTSSLLGALPMRRSVNNVNNDIYRGTEALLSRHSVRCLKGHCTPLIQSDAGPDQINISLTTALLAANLPPSGLTGTWSILSGSGGDINNTNDPNAIFSGSSSEVYLLLWTISNNCGAFVQDTVKIDFITVPDSLFLVGGSCFSVGWNPAAAIPFAKTAPGQFTISTYLTVVADNGFKFLVDHSWNNNWGQAFGPYGTLAQTPNQNASISQNGNYHINVDFTTLTYTCILIDSIGSPDSLFLVGGSCPVTAWDTLVAIPFSKLYDGYFFIYAPLTANGGGLKFLVNHTLNNNYGQSNDGNGILAQSPNLPVNVAEDGFYRIEVNTITMTYSCVKTDWGIVGTAVAPYNWSVDTDLSYVGGSEPFTWQVNNFDLHDGVFKFRANNNWAINFGDDGPDGSLEHNGANIPVGLGTYIVKLILEPNNWHYTLTLTGMPCGALTVPWGGKTYTTVQIGTQCWMKENMDIGTMIAGTGNQSDNDTIEKYCYNNDPVNCAIYGGLYQWNEMMQYQTSPGVQGICPTGWHIPSDAEWCTLTIYLDPTVNCNIWVSSGTNAGGKMKETGFAHWDWPNTSATNESGFSALGAGRRNFNGIFDSKGYSTTFWSSSVFNTDAVQRILYYDNAAIDRNYYFKTSGYSVRCVKD